MWYYRLIRTCPVFCLVGTFSVSFALLAWTLATTNKLPSFEDPLVGFEARNTHLSKRLNTWRLLTEATSWNGLLSLYPGAGKSDNQMTITESSSSFVELTTSTTTAITNLKTTKGKKRKDRNGNRTKLRKNGTRSSKRRSSTTTLSPNENVEITKSTVGDSEEADDHLDTFNDPALNSKSHALSETFFCGKLLEDYVQFVLEPVSKDQPNTNFFSLTSTEEEKFGGLLEVQSLQDLCTLDAMALRLGGIPKNFNNFNKTPFHFEDYCERKGNEGCCPSWSIANYVLLLANKTTTSGSISAHCDLITETDVATFVSLLTTCAPFYAEDYLSEDCGGDRKSCPNVPEQCQSHENLVYTVLHYLVDYRLLEILLKKNQQEMSSLTAKKLPSLLDAPPKNSPYIPLSLSATSIFLPMAKSSKLLAYYRALTKFRVKVPTTPKVSENFIITKGKTLTTSSFSNSATNIQDLTAGSVRVIAADLGCKHSLFSEALVSDLALLFFSSSIIFGSLLAYTRSFLLTVTALLTNIASLGTAYFLYTTLFGVSFFPFLNLLSLIILIGIGSDNALIYCKAWSAATGSGLSLNTIRLRETTSTLTSGTSLTYNHHHQQLSSALCHVLASTFCASLTTCAAFFAGYFTSITSLRCFALFAGLSVAANFFITVVTFPAAILLSEKLKGDKNVSFFGSSKKASSKSAKPGSKGNLFSTFFNASNRKWKLTADAFSTFLFQKAILRVVFNYRYLMVGVFTLFATGGCVLVFYSPGLKLPTATSTAQHFQVFRSGHLFEQYDLAYEQRFWFARSDRASLAQRLAVSQADKIDSNLAPTSDKKTSEKLYPKTENSTSSFSSISSTIVMPIRVVFGIIPSDTGDHLDPFSRGHLSFDPAFNMSSAQSQRWLLRFCRRLRAAPFIGHPSQDPAHASKQTQTPSVGISPLLLTNCFIETLVAWMEARRCVEEVGNTMENRFPCCQQSIFPYKPQVFDQCLVEVVRRLHQTPSYLFAANRAGPRFESSSSLFSSNISSLPRVKAVVIEYDSVLSLTSSSTSGSETDDTLSQMATFWSTIEAWVASEVADAPEGLRSGWFLTAATSEAERHDLQVALAAGVTRSLLLSVGLAFTTVALTTVNLRLALLSSASIGGAIFTTIGGLVALDWRLNLIESITISLTIGLAIDATLHYTIAYKMLAKGNRMLGLQMTLARIGSPVAMGALTTFFAGSVMLFSDILAYIQIGSFLMLLSFISWLFSTLFHLSLLSIFGAHEERSSSFSILHKFWSKLCNLCSSDDRHRRPAQPFETELPSSPPPSARLPSSSPPTLTENNFPTNLIAIENQSQPFYHQYHQHPFHPSSDEHHQKLVKQKSVPVDNNNEQICRNKHPQKSQAKSVCMLRVTSI